MANINKVYDFSKANENLYTVDNYKLHPSQKSINLDNNGNIQLKNFNENKNTNNFYGDGRLGLVIKKDSTIIRPACSYTTSIINHEIYGWCLYNNWYQVGDFSPFDEVVIYKKHIKEEIYLEELGTWEYLTIKEKIVDDGGTHYSLMESPTYEYTDNTANAVNLVLQYSELEILDNCCIRSEIHVGSTCDMPADLWNGRKVSLPDTILCIKSAKEVTIGKGAFIQSGYGYNGGSGYYNLYSTNTVHQYADPGAPLGCGQDARAANTFQAELRDRRSPGIWRLNRGNLSSNSHDFSPIFGPGGLNSYGYQHDAATQYGLKMPFSSELNDKLYCGVGASTFYFGLDNNSYNDDTHQARQCYGSAGGGILIIQTPKMTFADKNSSVRAEAGMLSSRRRLGYGAGGSILIKAEELVFNENPETMSFIDDAAGVVSSSFQTSKINSNLTTYPDYIANPGQIQIEFDRWITKYDDEEYTPLTITDTVRKDHILDYYAADKKNAIGLRGTINEWEISSLTRDYTHSHVSPKFETGTFFKFYTQGLMNIDIDNWYDIYKLRTSYIKTTGTEIKIVFSLDEGQNWKYIDFDGTLPAFSPTSLSETDLGTKSNTPEELDLFTDQTFLTKSFVLPQRSDDNKTIDICIAIKTTKEHISPIFDSFWMEYDMAPVLDSPIPINPFNGEEFNNEYVDFVWLQPYQKYGSIQNRIEVNTIPSFEKDENILYIDEDDSSSSQGKIMLPYSPSKYDNTFSTVNYMKLPYLKNRKLDVINAYDSDRNSFVYDYESELIEYAGGDEYFHKGSIVTLKAQADIALPTITDFLLNTGTCPKSGNLKHYINFCGDTNMDNISDSKHTWEDTQIGSMVLPRVNTTHDFTAGFVDHAESRLKFTYSAADSENSAVLRRELPRTTMVRFKPKNLVMNVDSYLFNIYNDGLGHHSILSLYRVKDQFNKDKIYVRYYDGYSWNSKSSFASIAEDEESVIVCQYEADNIVNIFVNGIKLMNQRRAHYDDTNHSYYISHPTHITFGQDYKNNGGSNFIGDIMEYAVWDEMLSDEEIMEISKVPSYHLRYNFTTDSVSWEQVPYWDHVQDYKFATDRVKEYDNNDEYRWDITESAFANSDGRCYYSNHHSLLLGKYNPSEAPEDMFKYHETDFKPINGIPIMYNRQSRGNTSFMNEITYKDNNTIRQNYDNVTNQVILQDRYDTNDTNFDLDFVYRETSYEFTSTYQEIGMATGAVTSTEYAAITYSRYTTIRKYPDGGPFRFGYHLRHSNNSNYTIKDPAAVTSDLPFPLLDGYNYTLKFIANDSIAASEVWLFSNSDDNYKAGVVLFEPSMTTYTTYKYGFMSKDFNDTAQNFNYEYEEAVMIQRNGPNNCFEPIGMVASNDTSNKVAEAGYIDRYDISQYIGGDFLKKINYCEILGESDNALTDLRFFLSFDDNATWKTYNASTNVWDVQDLSVAENGMTPNELMALSTYNFEKAGGSGINTSLTLRTVLTSLDNRSTPYINMVKISYNGPMIIDSWDSEGSFYNGTEFYYNEGDWNPYMEPNFSDASQDWKEMGDVSPDPLEFVAGQGSKPSTAADKIFAGVRILLNPKGKYYWRIAAYNGQ